MLSAGRALQAPNGTERCLIENLVRPIRDLRGFNITIFVNNKFYEDASLKPLRQRRRWVMRFFPKRLESSAVRPLDDLIALVYGRIET